MQEKILFVDDDANILAAYKRNLRKQFDILTAPSGEEGLSLLQAEGPFAVVLSDLRMPGMDGFEFLSRVKERSPDSLCIMLTGHAELQSSLRAVNEGYIFRFLTKPCKMDILATAIRSGLSQYEQNLERRRSGFGGTATPGTRNILIVDDDPDVLYMLAHALDARPDVGVITADTGSAALRLLGSIKIDLVVLDREMPDVDGLDLFAAVTGEHPEIPVMLMTWHGDERLVDAVNRRSGCRWFEKPFEIDMFRDMVTEELQSGPKGVIDGISISAFLQMIEMEEKTCTLNIRSGGETGIMYFLKGQLMDAVTGTRTGQDAAFHIIHWNKAAIEIEDICRKREKNIRNSLMQILVEAARLNDDRHPVDPVAI
jgi:DNA-binding NtrC family response regulator